MRAKSILISVAALMIAATCVAAADKGPKQVTFTCKVVDASGKAVGGAEVVACKVKFALEGEVRGRLLSKLTTKADGAFVVSAAKASSASELCVIAARKAGLAMAWTNWDMSKDETKRIVLGKAAVLSGVVVDRAGKPVAGAEVMGTFSMKGTSDDVMPDFLVGVAAMPWGRTTTDARGRFQFSDMPGDTKAGLIVAAPGLAKRIAPDEWRGGMGNTFTPGDDDVRITMSPEAVISGTVVDRKTGKGANDVTLSIRPVTGDFNPFVHPRVKVSGGKFTAGQLPAGRYAISLATSNKEMPRWVAVCDRITVRAGQNLADAKVELTTGGIIEVVVADAKTKAPVAGTMVALAPHQERSAGRFKGMTDKDGMARFRVLPGRYGLAYVSGGRKHVHKSFYRPGEEFIATVEEGKTARLSVSLDKAPRITGVVRDKAGRPVEGATVAFSYGSSVPVRTDKDGNFEILAHKLLVQEDPDDESSGERIIVRHAGRKLVASIKVPKSLKAEVTLGPAASVSGRVVDPEGKPIGKARIELMMGSSVEMRTFGPPTAVDAKGRFTIGLLFVGPHYKLTARAKGYGVVTHEFSFKRAEVLKVDDMVLDLANKVVSGVVVDANGQPVAGAKVSAAGWGMMWSRPKSVTTDASGRFEIKGLAKGHVTLTATRDDHSGIGSVKAGDTNVKIVLRKSMFGGLGPATDPVAPDD